MQITYNHHHRLFTMHSLFTCSLTSLLQEVKKIIHDDLFSFTTTLNYSKYLPLSPLLLHDAFIIHLFLFIHLTTLERKIFLFDEHFLSQTLLITQTTYHPRHHHRFFLMHLFINLFSHLNTLDGKKFLLDDDFISLTSSTMQTNYHHHYCRFFTIHLLFTYSLTSLLQQVKNFFLMTIFLSQTFLFIKLTTITNINFSSLYIHYSFIHSSHYFRT